MFYWPFQGGPSFVDHFCHLCFIFVMLSCLFLAALRSPAGNVLTSWLSCVLCFLVFLSPYHMVFWARLYRFLIFAFSLLCFAELWIIQHLIYCKCGNFRENLIFANSVKRHICDVKNSRLCHDLPTWVNDRMILPFREGLFSRNFAYAKFRENKPSRKFPN